MTKADSHSDREGASLIGGVGSADLATDSSDPDELRALLVRARERLSFYEGFDRTIAENVRRSGELMLETLTARENATANAHRGSMEERDRLLARLDDIDSGLNAVRANVDSLSRQIDDLRASLDAPPVASRSPAALPEPAAPGDDTWATPRVIEVIAHRVTKAATALSLQRYLSDLEMVVRAEAREFAEGVLRMQVTARNPLGRADLTGWTECGPVSILQMQPEVIEIDVGPGVELGSQISVQPTSTEMLR